MATKSPPQQIIILGAGVTGLSTALSFLSSPATSHFKITLIAAHLPGDLSPNYTSPWAGGDWHSHASMSEEDAAIRGWDARTYEVWLEMLSSPPSNTTTTTTSPSSQAQTSTKPIGLTLKTLRYFWGSHSPSTHPSGSGIWFSSLVRDFRVLDLEEEMRSGRPVPSEAVFGTSFTSMTFDPVVYLGFLLRRVEGLGGMVVRAKIKGGNEEGIEGVVREMVKVVRERGTEEDGRDDVFAVVNCAGLSARHFLPPEEAEKLFPVRGQTVLVKGVAKDAYTYVSIPSAPIDDILYVIPRPGSGITLLGGCKQIGSWDEDIDMEMAERIMERVKREKLAAELRTGSEEEGGRGFEVLKHQVGFRPGRKGGPRVEVEGERVGGVWVVHNYGHGGGGFQASVGCAERVVEFIVDLL